MKASELWGAEKWELLKNSGLSLEKIKELSLKQKAIFDEMKDVNRFNQVDDDGNMKELGPGDVDKYEVDKKKADINPKESRSLNSWGEGQSFLDRFDRTAIRGLTEVANLAQYAATGKGNETLTKIIDDANELDEDYTTSQQTPIRQKEAEALNAEFAKAKGFGQTVKAGAKIMFDKASNPSEWNVGGLAGDVFHPLNLVPLGAGKVAAKLGKSKLGKIGAGAVGGAVTQGVVNSGYEYGVAKSTNKSDEEAEKAAIMGGFSGVAFGGVFGSVAGGFSKSAKPKIKESLKAKKVEAMSSEEINDKIYVDANGKEVPDEALNKLFDNELLQIDEVEKSAAKAKPIIDEISTKAQTPDEINAMVAQYAPPTQKEVSISLITNGQEVSPRFAGMRIRDALLQSIENPKRSAGEMYSVLVNEGFSQEKANVIVQSYVARDVAVFDSYASGKIGDIIDVEVIEKIKQLEFKDERNTASNKDGERDAVGAESGNDAVIDSVRGEDGTNTEQSSLSGGKLGGDEALRNDGLDTSKSGEATKILSKDKGVDGHEAVGVDSTAVSRGGTDEVVSDQDAVYTGGGLDKRIQDIEEEISLLSKKNKENPSNELVFKQKIDEAKKRLNTYKKARSLKEHPKFEQHLKERENVKSTDIRYGNTQTAKGVLTEDGEYIQPQYEKNWLSNFDITKADVKKIREGKAEEATLAKLEDDLYRYDNDPTYYEPEVKLEEKVRAIGDDEDIEFNIDNWFTEKDELIGDLVKANNENISIQTSKKMEDEGVKTKTPELSKPKTKGERKATNSKVQEIIKKPIDKVTPEDKKILENYTGKGGIESGTKESLTQHYTDSKTVNAMFKALEDAKIDIKTALEPAVGSGNFIKGRKNLKWSSVDIDRTNHEVVKRLYQGDHQLSGYESYKPKEKFDLIISNVPFSEERGAGRLAYRPDIKALHDSFFIKALDDVKDDGVVAFITSKGVMDKANSKVRKEITSQADVIGAYRLPDSAFKHTHTSVITDVIFLQKRPKGVKSRMSEANKAFETTSKDDSGINMSDYYRQNPDNILGEMKAGVDPMYGKPAYLVTGESDLSKMKIDYEAYGVRAVESVESGETKVTLPNRKVELLRKIKDTLDVGLIKEYQQKYKKHPENDKGLKNYFRDSPDDLYELGSYFDKDFKPAEIFYKEARYSGSGKIEVTADSPLRERLSYLENQKGIINNIKIDFIKEDLETTLDAGYAYIGDGKIQNDVLFYSGNIYQKINKMREITDRDVSTQISTLQELIPSPKTLEQISFSGNEAWLKNVNIYKLQRVAKWVKVPGGGEKKVFEFKSEFGEVFDNHLNNRKLISEKKNESETAFKRRLREAQTEIKDILQEIKQRASTQADVIEDIYNRKFNFYRSPDYKKMEYMIADALKELPRGFSLRETQKKFIIKSLYEGKGINAHDVGGGKTFAGIVLGRILKQKGIAKKPLYVVPSKVIKNWQKEILQLYPDAKVVNLGNLNKSTRTKQLFALSNQNADFVLISQEGFKELKLPADVEKNYARALLDEHQNSDDLKGRALAVQEERIRMYLEVLAKTNSDKRVTIDKLGIDAIIADEARAFKNIGVKSSLARLGLGKAFGLKTDEKSIVLQSALAYDFRFKTRYVSERNNNSNIYMLDATPTPNKPLELFTMLKHLDNRIFDEYDIRTDEDFVAQFLETGLVQQKSGQFKDGITGIKNVFELRSIMDRFIDRISMKEFRDKGYIDIPESKVYKHIIDSSDENDIVFSDIRERLAEAKIDKEKRKDVLGIFSNGVNASVDPRLYAKAAINELAYRTSENNKISKVIELVSERRKSDKNAGQIIFVDNAGHSMKHLDTNLHQEIKTKLLSEGYKKDEIAIISGQEITNVKTGLEQKASGNRGSEMKQQIVNAYDSGKIKIVIGTTKSAGEGMNIQKYTTDIYHLDLPWTPAEITQRNGRGVRYGNINKEVGIHYMFTQGSFDDLMFNTITKKQGWNDLIWDAEAKNNLKIADSDGGGLPSPDEIMLSMEKDPIVRAEMELRIEHDKLNENLANIDEEVRFQKGRLSGANADIADLKKRISKAENEIKTGDIDTKEMRDLFMKSKKSPLHKKTYDDKLKKAIEVRKKILETNKNRLQKLERVREQTKRDLDTAKGDLVDGEKRLEVFEADKLDDSGNFRILGEC